MSVMTARKMSTYPIYRFVTRKEILDGCPSLTDALITQAILNKNLYPVIEGNGTERFRGNEVEAYLAQSQFDYSVSLKH